MSILYLNVGVGLLGVEADADGEEVVGVAAARELHAARLVGRVYHRKLKQTIDGGRMFNTYLNLAPK